MKLIPEDPGKIQVALDQFVELVGWQRDPKIRRLAFFHSQQNGIEIATLEISAGPATDIYEYSVRDAKVIPRRWTRLIPGW